MCSEDEHIDPRQAAAEEPPPGWWDLTPRPAAPPDDAAGLPGRAAETEP